MTLSPGLMAAIGNLDDSEMEFSNIVHDAAIAGVSDGADFIPSGDDSLFVSPEPVPKNRIPRRGATPSPAVSALSVDDSLATSSCTRNSHKLSRRRKEKEKTKRVTRKGVSPGAVILSDSDSEALSPIVRQGKDWHCFASPEKTAGSSRTNQKTAGSPRPNQKTAGSPRPNQSASTSQEVAELCVIDVCSSRELFETFGREWLARERFSMAVAMDKLERREGGGGIGGGVTTSTSS